MCGIAGIVDLAGEHTPAEATILRMNEALRHRGPDGGGVVLLPGLGFGHRRLAVIDLATGAQPMASGRLLISYNGEIYNFRELRRELEGLGHQFRPRATLRCCWQAGAPGGRRLLDRLNGMFAFALWDGSTETLLLARDRLGEKPLYHARDRHGRLVFASEIDAIGRALNGTPALNREALADYLAFGYVPDPRSIWQGVHKLRARTLSAAAAPQATDRARPLLAAAVRRAANRRHRRTRRGTAGPARPSGPPPLGGRRTGRRLPVGRRRLRRRGRP